MRDPFRPAGQGQGIGDLLQHRLALVDALQPFQGSDPPLKEIGHPADGHHRPGEHGEVAHEGDKIADGDAAANDQPAADVDHDQQADVGDQAGKGPEYALDIGQFDVLVDIGLAQIGKAGGLRGVPGYRPSAGGWWTGWSAKIRSASRTAPGPGGSGRAAWPRGKVVRMARIGIGSTASRARWGWI